MFRELLSEKQALTCSQNKKYLFLVLSVKKIFKLNIYQMSKCTVALFIVMKSFMFSCVWECGWF